MSESKIGKVFGSIDVQIVCDGVGCTEEAIVTVPLPPGGSDLDEVEILAIYEAGWDEEKECCPVCARSRRAEDSICSREYP